MQEHCGALIEEGKLPHKGDADLGTDQLLVVILQQGTIILRGVGIVQNTAVFHRQLGHRSTAAIQCTAQSITAGI